MTGTLVETFLPDCMGTGDTPYTRAVGLYMWTAQAGRVLSPGCQADMVPIFKGPQGIGKTNALKALPLNPDWYVNVDLRKSDDEIARSLRGRTTVELDELRGLRSRDQDSLKSFLTRTHDTWTPKYKEFATTHARSCVIYGTTNEDAILTDPTGNRRYLPVDCAWIDLPRIVRQRDQLWVEAAALWKSNGVMWQGVSELAESAREESEAVDLWEPRVAAWLDSPEGACEVRHGEHPPGWFTLEDCLAGAFSVMPRDMRHADGNRVGAVLRRLGFASRQLRVSGGRRVRLWFKE